MKHLIKKIVILTASLIILSSMSVMAAETTPGVEITVGEIAVDKDSGQYSFKICIDAAETYAGAEFGVICSQGVEITSVSSEAKSMTGPKEANGLVWFGFFEGEDNFNGEMTVTVEGTYEPGTESAIVIQDIKIYTIGDQEYTSTSLEAGMLVNLNADSVTESASVPTGDNGINIVALLAVFMVIVATAVIVLIYIRKMRGERKNVFQQNNE